MTDSADLSSPRRWLGEQLRHWRKAAGLKSQTDLAKAMGYSRTAVGQAECGWRDMSPDFWEKADARLGAERKLLDGYRWLQSLGKDEHKHAARDLAAANKDFQRWLEESDANSSPPTDSMRS